MELRISDTGPGVPADERDRIFEPFEQLCDPARTDSMSRGTGLGLTMARQISRRLRGTLDLVQAPTSAGATFRLQLPLD